MIGEPPPVLSDPARSRAVLVGSHAFASLEDLPGVRNNLTGLERLVRDPRVWGLPESHCVVVEQPANAGQVVNAIKRAAREAEDTLVVYYAGHGLVDEEDDGLWLALPESQRGEVYTALPYDWVRRAVLADAPKRTVVILDCCFSGRAMTGRMSAGAAADDATIKGTFLMTSATETKASAAPPGETYTAFTGELIGMLEEGIPGEPAALDMATVYHGVRKRLIQKGRPLPDQRNRNAGALIRIFRNRAPALAPPQEGPDREAEAPAPVPMSAGPAASVPAARPDAGSAGEWPGEDQTAGWAWRDDAFRWGPLRTPLLIIEGDGENVIAESAVRLIVDRQEVRLPDEIAAWRREIEAEQEARRERGDDFFWNGRSYAVEKVAISRDAHTEAPAVSIRLKLSDYYSFLAAQQLDREFADGTTPRGRYLDPHGPLDVPAFMSSSFGANIAVVTADHKIIFSRRSASVGSHPGYWNSSANEGLSRDIDSAARSAPNLYNVARRGMREELALEADEYRIDMLALTVDRKNQWGALFVARLFALDADGFLARRSRGVADKFEHAGHRLVPFQTKAMVDFMFAAERRALWAPTAPALFYLALVNEYGRQSVEDESLRAFRELIRAG
ncbi:caspase domain-containing protein [Actinomadura sp. GTD37]|uniref:caspase family protein n=1 Tax=Actinomadura sp. GTD37 TaxID=1778030 RepID=UPI0035C1E2C1